LLSSTWGFGLNAVRLYDLERIYIQINISAEDLELMETLLGYYQG
jgi:hypothetical protein